MRTTIIQLDPFDNFISIKDKIAWSKTPRILLVWPNKGKIRLSSTDILLILRAAEDLGAHLSVVTDEPIIIKQLKSLGVSIFTSIPEAQKKPWRKPKIRNRSLIANKNEGTDRTDKIFNYSKNIQESPLINSTFTKWLIFLTGIISTLALILFFVPSANITIFPETEQQTIELNFRSNPSIQEINLSGAIPARIISIKIEDQLEGESNGIVRIPDRKASGKVLFRNLSDRRIVIPAGTIVRTEDEVSVRFETLGVFILPPGVESQVEVQIQSLAGGTIGNVPAGSIVSIENDLGGNVTVFNSIPTSGGVDVKTFTPTKQNYEQLRIELFDLIKLKAIEEIKKEYPNAFIIPIETVSIEEIIAEVRIPEVGDPAERHLLRIKAEISAWMVDENDFENAIKIIMDADLSENYKISDEKIVYKVEEGSISYINGSLSWDGIGSRKIIAQIDENGLVQKIVGKNMNVAMQLIASEVKSRSETEINIFPSFWKNIPFLASRINMVIDG